MELLAIIAVLFTIGFAIAKGHVRRLGKRSNPEPKTTLSPRPPTPRFDPQTAKQPPKLVRLRGRAYIIDGDSLVIQKTQVRLFGIDAPEINHPYGKKAKWALVSLCKGQSVTAEIVERDAHGRTVANCTLDDGRDLSAEMVKQGLAVDWAKFSGGKYRSLEIPDARKRLWLADARQKGRMHVWEKFEATNKAASSKD